MMDKAQLQQRLVGLFIWAIILGVFSIFLNQGVPKKTSDIKLLVNNQPTVGQTLAPFMLQQPVSKTPVGQDKPVKLAKTTKPTTPKPVVKPPKKKKSVAVKTAKQHIQKKPQAKPKPKKIVKQKRNHKWFVQLGSFSKKNNAERLKKLLINKGYSVSLHPIKHNHRTIVRVWVGPEKSRYSAKLLKKRIRKKMDIGGIIVSRK
jgi:cell division septation protein DedD